MAINGNGNGNNDFHIGKASLVTIIGVLIGIIGSFIYLGATFRQIEVNSVRLSQIEEHGSPTLQAIRSEITEMQKADENIRKDFRPREFWENLAVKLATLDARIDYNERTIRDYGLLCRTPTVVAPTTVIPLPAK